jgi:pyruvate dehydrogenase E2 component (dihydrolipoamide acetyltransferase)
MPQVGETTLEGKITAWLKKEGDRVAKGEPLFEIETDKATMDVESYAAGILRKILVPAGSVAKVTEVVAIIAEAEDNISAAVPAAAAQPASSAAPMPQAGKTNGDGAHGTRRRISPLARKVAASAGLSPDALYGLTGTGLDGAVNQADVLQYLASTQAAKPTAAPQIYADKRGSEQQKGPTSGVSSDPRKSALISGEIASADRVIPLSRMRRAIAERMTFSTREAPQFWMGADVSFAALVELREKINQRLADQAVFLSYTDFIIKAVAMALRESPFMNASYSPNGITQKAAVNVGFAAALEEGLVVPVVRNADSKKVSQISAERSRLAESARNGTLSQDELSGGTFTVSNLGMFRVDQFVAILNPPETGILSVGRIRQALTLRDGQVAMVPTVSLGLTIDHRSTDGAQGAKFLEKVIERLEEPLLLLV